MTQVSLFSGIGGNTERPILRYHGGKWILAPWIISHFPEHKVYTEVYGGAGSVLMRKQRSYAEIYNDLSGVVVNVFRVLRDPLMAKELERMLRLTPFSRAEFFDCTEDRVNATTDPVEKARLTIFRSFAGFGSGSTIPGYSTGFRSNSNRSGSTPAHDWMRYPDHVRSFTERLQGVIIENKDAIEVAQNHDADTTLHYIDPPYMRETRHKSKRDVYEFEMSDFDHMAMLEAIKQLNGMVILSGYKNELYDTTLNDWIRIDKKAFADGASPRVESIWLNPKCADRQKTKTLFQP